MSTDRWTRFSVDWCQESPHGGSGIIFVPTITALSDPSSPFPADDTANPSQEVIARHGPTNAPDPAFETTLLKLQELRRRLADLEVELTRLEAQLIDRIQH